VVASWTAIHTHFDKSRACTTPLSRNGGGGTCSCKKWQTSSRPSRFCPRQRNSAALATNFSCTWYASSSSIRNTAMRVDKHVC
jgi:hypothetical protein